MPSKANIAGQRFGRLVAVLQATSRNKNARWKCQCDCGRTTVVFRNSLMTGSTSSCGCLSTEVKRLRKTTHGQSKTATFGTWRAMIARCGNKNHRSYKNYGGRGIDVCERWRSFENFLSDMGHRPHGMMIERKDNDGNYEPMNCVWATMIDQNSNTRKCVQVEIDGRTFKTIAQAARFYGLRPVTVRIRLSKYRWGIERALKTPLVVQHTPNRFRNKEKRNA